MCVIGYEVDIEDRGARADENRRPPRSSIFRFRRSPQHRHRPDLQIVRADLTRRRDVRAKGTPYGGPEVGRQIIRTDAGASRLDATATLPHGPKRDIDHPRRSPARDAGARGAGSRVCRGRGRADGSLVAGASHRADGSGVCRGETVLPHRRAGPTRRRRRTSVRCAAARTERAAAAGGDSSGGAAIRCFDPGAVCRCAPGADGRVLDGGPSWYATARAHASHRAGVRRVRLARRATGLEALASGGSASRPDAGKTA